MNFFFLLSLISAIPTNYGADELALLANDVFRPSVGRVIGFSSLAAIGGATVGAGGLLISAKRKAGKQQQQVSAAGL
jgi:hypothetical protein